MLFRSRQWLGLAATCLLSLNAIAETRFDRAEGAQRLPAAEPKVGVGVSQKASQRLAANPLSVKDLCQKIGSKLGSVSIRDCDQAQLQSNQGFSHGGLPMAWAEFPPMPEQRQSEGRVLVLGGIHGDEYSAVSIVFHWLKILQRYHSGLFHWRVVPVANPDGLLQRRSQRMNAKGVDLNRNFPTENWQLEAPRYWAWTGHNKRRYPGESAASEPETRWIMRQIEEFDPDVIVQIHAPYGIVDFDGNHEPPKSLGRLHLNLLGTFPGSLGNYGGKKLDIPVLTVELPSAGVLPSEAEQTRIWVDLIRWLRKSLPRKSNQPVKETVSGDLKAAAESGYH